MMGRAVREPPPWGKVTIKTSVEKSGRQVRKQDVTSGQKANVSSEIRKSAHHGVAHLSRTLEQPGVEVEDITGVSLTTGGTPAI